VDRQQFQAYWAHEENQRLDRLIIYFQDLLNSIPDNPDPESDAAIERQLLLARISTLEVRTSTLEAGRPSPAPVSNEGPTALPKHRSVPDVETIVEGGKPQTGAKSPSVSAPAPAPAAESVKKNPEVRIVVIDDHEVVRRGITALLETQPGWKVVAEADNGEEAIEMVKLHKPDIALMNVCMPGRLDGIAATRVITRDLPAMRVLIHTMHGTKQLIRDILEAGARGYLMTSDAARDLIMAVETILEGKLFFTQTVSEILLDGFLEKPLPMRTEISLTKREIEIVCLLARGKTNKQVATELNISLRRAETHRANIMNKLQFRTVQDLVRYAVKNRLIDL